MLSTLLASFLPILLNYVILKIFHPNFQFLKDNYTFGLNHLLIFINSSLFSLCSLQFIGYFYEAHYSSLGFLGYFLTFGFIVLQISLLMYLSLKIQLIQHTQIESLREEQLKQLSQYTNQIEGLYNDIRGIRHDYINVIKTLQNSIEERNLKGIEETFNFVIKNFGASLQGEKFAITYLDKVKISAVKSLLASKLIQAQTAGIQINVEIDQPVTTCYINLLDYIRILSVFLDNAIDASKQAANPILSIALIVDKPNHEEILVVKNNCKETTIDKRKIFELGYSSKGKGRGIGLATVKGLLIKHPNINLETEFKNHFFTQTLVLQEEP